MNDGKNNDRARERRRRRDQICRHLYNAKTDNQVTVTTTSDQAEALNRLKETLENEVRETGTKT